MTKFNLFDCRLLNVGKTIRYSTHLGAAIQAQLVKFSKPIGFIKQLILLLFLCTNYAPLYAQCTAATNTVLSTLDANNGQRGEMFNIVAVNPITVHCFSPHLYTSVLGTYEIYYRNGGFLGHENTPADWIFIDSTTNLTGTANVGTLIPIDVNIPVPAGDTVAFYITCVGTSPSYGGVRYYGHSAAPAGPVDSLWLEDANMKLLVGYGKDYLFGTNYITRRYLGEVHYSLGVCPTVPTLYVDANITTSGNGESWATAYKTLDEALAVAHCCTVVDTIKVATGTYIPTKKPYNGCTEMTTADARDLSFHLPDGLVLWGGYPAGGGVRNIPANITTLSGDFNGDDVVTGSGSTLSITGNGENAYHVVLAAAATVGGIGVTIDGFSIVGGNASGSFNSYITINGNNIIRNSGGGIYINNGTNILTNNTLLGNSAGVGGGICTNGGANTLTNNTLLGNSAGGGGGGICINYGTNNTLTNNTLSDNSAGAGGGIYTYYGTNNTLINNTLSGNSANNGGGIYTYDNSNTLTNNTLSGNSAAYDGGGILTNNGVNTLTNNIFWDNKRGTNATILGADYYAIGTNGNTFTNNLLQLAASNYTTVGTGNYDLGASASGNIFAQDPLFVDADNIDGADNIHRTADDGLRLVYGSPALNTGTTIGAPTTDILGTARPQGAGIDMGAYEGGVCPTVPTLYVDASIAVSGGGQSWATAFKTLEEALAIAHCCSNIDTIKVATGTYLPTKKPYSSCNTEVAVDFLGNPLTARDNTFHLPDGLVLWGGYPAGGGVRDIPTNVTTLSGDFNGNDVVTGSGSTLSITNNTENAYHVVLASAATVGGIGVTIDGFSIIGGNANGSSFITVNGNLIYRYYGGGIYTDDGTNTLTNNTLSGNSANDNGGGICTQSGTNTITNNTLSGNTASNGGGGGIFTSGGTNTQISNNTLSGNSANTYGGGIYTFGGTNTITNNTLSGNSASSGGGIYTYLGTNTITNNTLSGNSASSGGGIYTNGTGTNTLTNNIFWGNFQGTSSTVGGANYHAQGTNSNTLKNNILQLASSNYPLSNTGNYAIGTAASGNIFAQDPLFVDATDIDGADDIHRTADDGLRLQIGSPCINTGNNTGVTATDITGAARIQNTTVDMGAYEGGVNVCPTVPTLYVDASIAASGDGQTWATAKKTLDEALAVAHCCSIIDTIKVAIGTYLPTKKPYNGCTEITTTDARDLTFHLPDGLVLWGGYPTGGGVRNSTTNITTLSGDFNGDDDVSGSGSTLSFTGNGENAYHVVLASTTVSGAGVTIDGFTIRGGSANDNSSSFIIVNGNGVRRDLGGGIHTNNGANSITNNILTGNSARIGGAIYLRKGTNTLSNSTVINNRATTQGGGIATDQGTYTISDNTIVGNYGNNEGGIAITFSICTINNNTIYNNASSNISGSGAIGIFQGTNTLSNNAIYNNSGGLAGGIYLDSGTNTLFNNTLYNNTNGYYQGGAIRIGGGINTLTNNIFWGNKTETDATIPGADFYALTNDNTFTNNLLQLAASNYTTVGSGNYDLGTAASGNIFAQDPLFVNAADIDGADNIHRTADDGLQLSCGSPAYNAATATSAPTTDITGTTRPQFGVVDMGAYESVNNLNVITNAVSTDAACNGGTGSVDVSATGGTSPYTGTGTFTETAGTYTYTVTDANGCSATASATVAEPTQLTPNAVSTDAACNGGAGSVDVSATGGTSPYTGTGTFNETAGTYTYTVTDDNGCSATASATVGQAGGLVVSAVATDAACNGGAGSVDVSATGGTSPYTGTGTFTETAGTYTYTVTDANGCSATASATVSQPTQLTASAIATDAACNGGTGSVVVSASGGTSPYTGTGTFTETAGTYTYTVTDDNGCSATASATVSQPTQLTASAIATDALCNGGAGSVDVSATGGTSPYTGTGTFTETAGTYTYTVTDDNGCSATASATVSQPTQLTASAIATDAACNGGAGSVDVSATGGTSPYTGTGTFTETAGTYTYTVTDDNGCSATASATVSQPTQLTASAIATDAACNGGAGSVDVSATGGTSPYTGTGTFTETAGTYTYTVTDDNGCSATASATVGQAGGLVVSAVATDAACNGGAGSVDVSATGGTSPYTGTGTFTETAGTYTYTVTDDNGCSATASATVSQPTQLTASAIATDAACFGGTGSVDVSATGGTSPYTGTGTFTETAGTYTYTVTDDNGCSATASATVSQPTQLTASAIATDAACNGGAGSVDVSATGGTSPYTGTGTFTETAGTYTYTVTDDNGCSATASASVAEPTPLNVSATPTAALCNGGAGSVVVSATGGTSPYTGTGTFTETAGTYTYTVTDANGCSATASATVGQPSILSASSMVSSVTCHSGSNGSINVTTTGGKTPYTYVWSNGATTEDLSGVSTGTYVVTVTDDNGCSTVTLSANVSQPAAFNTFASVTNAGCAQNDGAINLTVSGATPEYSYIWSNGNTIQDPSGLSAGTYAVTISDTNGCSTTTSASITALPLPSISMAATSCFAGSGIITVTASGTGLTYSIGGASQNSNVFNNVANGNYTVVVTNSSGCTASKNVTVSCLPCSIPVATNNSPVCVGANIGLNVNPNLSNGVTASYAWSGPAGSSTQKNPVIANATLAKAGVYTVTVTYSNGCVATASTTVIVNAKPTVTIAASGPLSFCAGGSVTLTAGGGNAYNWSNGSTTAFTTIAISGTYTVTVTNAAGCTATAKRTIVVNALPNVSANLSCGISSATITVNATGNPPFQYSIGGAFQGSNVFNNVANGTYVVTVTNVNGCSRTTSIVVNCVYCSATAASVTATASCAGEPIVATASGYNTATGYAFYYLLADANGNIVAVNTTGTFATTSLTIGATYTVYGYNVKTSALVGGPNPPAVGTNVGSITGSCFALSNASATVVIPNLITIANSSSEGASNGTSPFTYNTTTIEITGGTTPYNFDWDIEGYVRYDIAYTQTGATITIYYSNDASWSVTTTDGNECTTGGAVFSNLPGNVNTLLDIDSYTVTPTNLGNDGSINLAASGGNLSCGTYQYQWTGPDTWTGSYATTGNGAYTLSGLPSGWYSVIITDCAGNTAEGWYWVPEGSRGRTKAVETLSVLPNPFADKAIVEFSVNVSGNTTVNVYSIDGKQVATLYNANTQAGETYQVTLDGANLPSGMYFVKMTNANGETMLQKVMINR